MSTSASFEKTEIEGVWLFNPNLIQDERGSFFEAFRTDTALVETGFDFRVSQMNTSVSRKGTLRGIHFKQFPPGQAKYVWVSRGKTFDVVIDLRKSSPTFGNWQGFELSDENGRALLLGYGIGHAFLALEDDTSVSYLCDSVFQPSLERSINPLAAGIDWLEIAKGFGVGNLLISERDQTASNLDQAAAVLFE